MSYATGLPHKNQETCLEEVFLMPADDRNDATLHDLITRRCTLCGHEKPVPPGTADDPLATQ